MMLPVAILAGGLATRLRPITQTLPKALVDVAGEPFIFHQLRYLRKQGISRVVLCVGYLGEMLQQRLGEGAQFDLELSYSFDGPTLLGTGGALKQAIPLLGDAFFVLYGDSFLPINFSSVQRTFEHCEKPALMTVLENANNWDKSNVIFRNGQIQEYNKKNQSPGMNHIDYGLGILTRDALEHYPPNHPFDLAEVYHLLSLNGELAAHEVYERFYEIGSHAGLNEAQDFFSKEMRV